MAVADAGLFGITAATLLPTAITIVPGLIAWKTDQKISPELSQKATDALAEILGFSFFNALIWSLWRPPTFWSHWPATPLDVLTLLAQILLSPILLALAIRKTLDTAARRDWITSPYPTAWDFVFRKFVRKAPAMLLITLKNEKHVGGAYINDGHTALTPYDHDIFLNEVWDMDADGFVEKIFASRGLLVKRDDILTVEFFDYFAVLAQATERAHLKERESNQ